MEETTATQNEALRKAFRAGKRSSLTGVDADEAAARWSRRNCPPHSVAIMCELEHAWYDGFEHDCRPAPAYMTRRIPR